MRPRARAVRRFEATHAGQPHASPLWAGLLRLVAGHERLVEVPAAREARFVDRGAAHEARVMAGPPGEMLDRRANEDGLIGDGEAGGRAEGHFDLAWSEFGLDRLRRGLVDLGFPPDRLDRGFDPIETVLAQKVPAGVDVLQGTCGSYPIEMELEFEASHERIPVSVETVDRVGAEMTSGEPNRVSILGFEITEDDGGSVDPGEYSEGLGVGTDDHVTYANQTIERAVTCRFPEAYRVDVARIAVQEGTRHADASLEHRGHGGCGDGLAPKRPVLIGEHDTDAVDAQVADQLRRRWCGHAPVPVPQAQLELARRVASRVRHA
jgi:hypothetical protein